ncbi:MAG: NADH-quinone oxidoreductase subunit C [Proteobacteria bacterium]|nr:NADH-quinone oxidoreductase subunit C [Pseudomonadota bacterium]MBU1711228.1 NADH-quinone oxidoreductase subunit C [Pseudomonadota bacterium]
MGVQEIPAAVEAQPAVVEEAQKGEQTPDGEGAEKEKAEEGPRQPVMVTDYAAKGFHLDAEITPDKVVAAAQILNRENFFIEAVTGVDWINDQQMEVVYDFNNFSELCRVVVRVRIPRDNPQIPTICKVFSGAEWHERETHDFFGIVFEGHPDLSPLLLPEDADFHPLLKDFKA